MNQDRVAEKEAAVRNTAPEGVATATHRAPEDLACDAASIEIIGKAQRDGIETCFTRMESQRNQCGFGTKGICCRICYMGPCRITPRSPRGVCGADADTIVARNLLREVAGGAAAHADHGRHLALLFRKAANGCGGSYMIHDRAALRDAALVFGVPADGRPCEDVARDLAEVFIEEFTVQEAPVRSLRAAPVKRQEIWKQQGIEPHGIDRTIVECLHRSTMGVDHDYRNILLHALRTALADGWAGSRVATMASDILFGTPQPVRSQANLGVLGTQTVNVIVHGHEPALSEMLAEASRDREILEAAKGVGAEGVTLAGICCTANEVLVRRGIAVAGSFLQQELAIVTGAVEMMVTDVQCCMASLPKVASAYHTQIVSTSDIARTIGVDHDAFDEQHAYESAKRLLKRAIANYPNRDPSKVAIPDVSRPLMAGFSVAAIRTMLGGSFRPLTDALLSGQIKGMAAIVGCNNPKSRMDEYINVLTAALLKRDILVVQTGCAAIASGKEGLLSPETAAERAGVGLKGVYKACGVPPVIHMGSCVDNARLLEMLTEMTLDGELGEDLADLPVVGVAPEWMSEKSLAIGCYFVASGINVILGSPLRIGGSPNIPRFLGEEIAQAFGASLHVCPDPEDALAKITGILEAKRRDKERATDSGSVAN